MRVALWRSAAAAPSRHSRQHHVAGLAVTSESNVPEDLSAFVADLSYVDSVLRQQRSALFFSDPHENTSRIYARQIAEIWVQLGSKTLFRWGPNRTIEGISAAESTGLWRKRVGVEPTIHPAKGRIAGFEDREDHRTPCASVYGQPVAPRGIIPWGRTCDRWLAQRGTLHLQPYVDVVWSQPGDRKRLILSSIFCGVSTSGRACTRSSAE